MFTPKQPALCPPPGELSAWVTDARQRTLDLVSDLSDEELLGPQLDIVNPLLWEIGHVAWFQEKWVLRHAAGEKPFHPQVDELYDSMAVAHDTRWDLPIFNRGDVLAYLDATRGRVLARLDRQPTPEDVYFVLLATFHEDMHTEAFTYTRQTHGLTPPVFLKGDHATTGSGPLPGDVEVPGGRFLLGSAPSEPFVFDNEKWIHEVEVSPFAIARAPVTQEQFAAFVDDDGYRRRELWSDKGWKWCQKNAAEHPRYWKRQGDSWRRSDFDHDVELEPHRPVLHVSWYEAEAWCRWAGRRLPTEVEWEVAAASEIGPDGELAASKRRFPWGEDSPQPSHARLDWSGGGCADVAAYPEGDSAVGCRQMIGNVWEWTSTDFLPYPGFEADAYMDYSEPWFGDHKVLRGGCWVTRGRMLRNTWRNFYKPDRSDVWAGFRTCA